MLKYLVIASFVVLAVGCKKEEAPATDAAADVQADDVVDVAQDVTPAVDATVTTAADVTATK